MSSRPPVCARFVPGGTVLGLVARFSFWPLAFVGARAMNLGSPLLVAFGLILVSLVASSLRRVRWRGLATGAHVTGALVVAIPSYAAARAALVAMHLAPGT